MTIYHILVFAPLIGAIIAGFGGRKLGDKPSMFVTTALLFVSAALSWLAFVSVTGGNGPSEPITLMRWMDIGDFQANWALKIDTLTAVMLVVITSVSALVHLYSWGYMEEDDSKPRFFSYLSLFTFAMLMLVTSDNFIQLFFGWEGVGLASYLLIGFWYKKPSANAAAIKAFVTNRVGDIGLALGIMAIFLTFGSVNYDTVFNAIAENSDRTMSFLGMEWNIIELIALLLFIGAMGKSAQFVLHVWLPDAMEGPTPVSALIHAATMVTAGVFLVCRAHPIFSEATGTSALITYVGAFTALFAASVGLVQNDIKRVIAYSTCSQLGYMFFAAGVGAYNFAMFHLFTHAFFKALLFLGAGSVIHALHHQQDMRQMGGLWKIIPVTYGVMFIGTLAITGIGIPELNIGFAGFYSKDLIIEAAYDASKSVDFIAAGTFAFWAGLFAALMTSFYSWRLMFMTFHGKHRGKKKYLDEAHESPLVMIIPLLLLAIGAVFAGAFFYKSFKYGADGFWGTALDVDKHAEIANNLYAAAGGDVKAGKPKYPRWVLWAPLLMSVLGLILAWFTYIYKNGVEKRLKAEGGPLYNFLLNKWYIDEIYEATIVRATRWLGDVFWKVGDIGIIDRFGPNGVAAAAMAGAKRLSKIQSGYLYHYAFIMLIGVAAIVALVIRTMGG